MRYIPFYIIIAILFSQACSPAGGEKRGHEFMPDMVHSTAVEANLYNYYYYNTWGSEEEYKKMVMPKNPVAGTIPRGMSSVSYGSDAASRINQMASFQGTANQTQMAITPNGAAPYYYGDSDAERIRASQEIIDNPFPITENGLERGKELYVVYCGICHGDKGDGSGYLVREADPAKGIVAGVYPAQPANFLLPTFIDTTNGALYHSIMYGKNVMGSYKDKLSYEERWQVIHYIRALQAKELKMAYNAEENTLNNVDVPYASIAHLMGKADGDHGHDSDTQNGHDDDGEGHGEEHDGHDEDGKDHSGEEHGDDGHHDDGHEHK